MRLTTEATLAIEASILGGSVTVRAGGKVHTYSGDPPSAAKAEFLLPKIDELIRESGISRHEIKTIVVSAGPGSFTGIRIGISTALGLARAVGAKVRIIPVLAAIASASKGIVCASIPVGRGMIASQIFEVTDHAITAPESPILHSAMNELRGQLQNLAIEHLITANGIEIEDGLNCPATEAGVLSELLASAAEDPRVPDSDPIFLSKPHNA
ncbi:MAG: peptidase M22, glycoprotease [Acidobacteria bacterium OLB17]|nr:MAG: peptidase M22, glycoprotease [Acidobacteria bacterium OLB17]MCZ2389593.1 tRNA (adenosine(37)-N6)-threonylcarbamoyltransferase complex dimerization subunit type 1 TsaB [Acidobacteriota bacterium]